MKKAISHDKIIFLSVSVFFLVFLSFTGVALSSGTSSSNGPASLSGASMSAATAGGGSGSGADNFIFTGAAASSIPIEVPPGRLGMAPQISLAYSSQKGDGWIGVGWDLDMGSIQRGTKSGVNYSANDFVYTKNGASSELVLFSEADNEYRAKIEDGSFLRFIKTGNTWKAYDKNGMIYSFGQNDSSRQSVTGDPTKVFKWGLNRVEDPNGNFMTLLYETDGGALYLKQIDYTKSTNNTVLSAQNRTNSIVFNREGRDDAAQSYLTNSKVVMNDRLASIDINVQDARIGYYQLAYTYSPLTGRSVLSSVKRYNYNGTDSLPETVFSSNIVPGTSTPQALRFNNLGEFSDGDFEPVDYDNGISDLDRFRTADFNGDGKTDFVYIGEQYSDTKIYLSNSWDNGFTVYPFPIDYRTAAMGGSTLDYSLNRFTFADFNADGKTDILAVYRGVRIMAMGHYLDDPEWWPFPYISENQPNTLYLSQVDQDTAQLSFVSVAGPVFDKMECVGERPEGSLLTDDYYFKDAYLSRIKTGDFNGDGKMDILFIEGNDDTAHASSIYLAEGSGNNISFAKYAGRGPLVTMRTRSTIEQCQDAISNGRTPKDQITLQRIRVADFNGDGKADIHVVNEQSDVISDPASLNVPSMLYLGGVYPNGAPHFTEVTAPPFPVTNREQGDQSCEYAEYYWAFYDLARIRYGDFNADGKTDILKINLGSSSDIYLGTGDATVPFIQENGPNFEVGYPSGDNFSTAMIAVQRIKLGDFNGDKSTDFLVVNGWGDSQQLSIFLTESRGNPPFYYSKVQSVGADNQPVTFYVSSGELPNQECEHEGYKGIVDVNRFMLGDFTGNGKTGFYYRNREDDHVLTLYAVSPDITDLVQKIDTSAGAKITLDYALSTWFPNSQIPFSIPVVSSTVIDLGNTDTTPNEILRTDYTYADGYYDIPTREFRGFGYVRQINPDETTLETWFHQKDVKDPVTHAYVDDEDLKGKPYYTEFREKWQGDTRGALLSTTALTWDRSVGKGTYPVFVRLNGKTVTSNIGPTTVETTETYTYDPVGNIKTVTAKVTDDESILTTNTYQNYGTDPVRIYRLIMTNMKSVGAPTLARKTTFDYETGTGNMLWKKLWIDDSNCSKFSYTYTTEGNLDTATDPKGNASGADPLLHKTTYIYDTETATFPTEVHYPATNGVEHVTKKEYDYRFGLPSASWDENGNETDYDYDDFGRPTGVFAYEGAGPTFEGQAILAAMTLKEYYDSDVANAPYIKTKVLGNISNGVDVFINRYDYYDGLGRPMQTITYGEKDDLNTKKAIVTRTYYNNMAQVYRTEGPYFSYGTGYPKAPTDAGSVPFSTTSYNSFGKPYIISSPVGVPDAQGIQPYATTNILYEGLSTTVIDPDGKKKTEKKDYLGRVIEVTEYKDDDTPIITTYDYKPAGDLWHTTDRAGNQTVMDYDTLGRKTYMNDPDMGEWKYCYDLNNNLIKQMDANGNIISFAYDPLNRISTKDYATMPDSAAISVETLCSAAGPPNVTAHPSEQVTYTYDQRQNGIGRLSTVTNANASSAYVYDSMGRPVATTETIKDNSVTVVTATTYKDYDYAGRLKTVTYPDGFVATYTYVSGTGLLKKVSGKEAVGESKDYASFTDYKATGKMGQIDYGNGVQTLYGYDPKSTRLTDMVSSLPAQPGTPATYIIDRGYEYTLAGDMREIADYKKGQELGLPDNAALVYDYTYDNLHRLKDETITPNAYSAVSYTYNDIGNIKSKTLGSNSFIYVYNTGPSAIRPHAVKRITVGTNTYDFIYDNNGNMTSGHDLTSLSNIGTREITYNADNKPVQIIYTKGGTSTVSFRYDGQGNRVMKSSNQGTTYYVGEHYEIIDGEATKYIFAGGLRIAKVDPSGTYYYHKDHLGSSSTITNDNAEVKETFNYRPFGDQRGTSGSVSTTNYKFTDQEYDAETGLYYYGARYYDPTIGRFISADSVVPDPFDPQTLNRYTYCRNNPLIYTDPNGHHPIFIAMAIGAVIGGVSAGIRSDWDLGAVVQGAFIGVFSAGIYSGVSGSVGAALGSTTVGGAAGGAAAGMFAGGVGAALGGGNVWQGMLKGGLIGGVVGGIMGAIDGASRSPANSPTTQDAETMVRTGDMCRENSTIVLKTTYNMADHLNNFLDAMKWNADVFRGMVQVENLSRDVQNIAYNYAEAHRIPWGEKIPVTLHIDYDGNYYTYHGYNLGHVYSLPQYNASMWTNVISHYYQPFYPMSICHKYYWKL